MALISKADFYQYRQYMKNIFLGAALLITGTAISFAASYTLDAGNRGHYQNNGGTLSGNYIAGNAGHNEYFRNYFVFDLSTIPSSDAITGAALRLFNPSTGYHSVDSSEIYTNFALESTSISSLITGNGSNVLNVAIYNDLGDGIAYSSRVNLSSGSDGTFIQITLNTNFLSYAQSNFGSTLAIGGALTTLDNSNDNNELVFESTTAINPSNSQLIINTVPEVSTNGLLIVTAVLLGSGIRSRTISKVDRVSP